MTTPLDTRKAAVLQLLASGAINLFEAAQLCGASRQVVRYWAREINLEEARARYLDSAWRAALRAAKQ